MTSYSRDISVDPGLFEDRDTDAGVFVETPDADTAAQALDAVSGRLFLVSFNGREHADEDELYRHTESEDATDLDWNANFVFDPERRPSGAYIELDTKGWASAEMNTTIVRIVTEGLTDYGITRAHLRPIETMDRDA